MSPALGRRGPFLIAVLLFLGAGRIGYFHFVREQPAELGRLARARIDDRYRALRPFLPSGARVGYASDVPLDSEEGAKRYVQALYALAPALIVRDDGRAPLVVGDAANEAALAELVRQLRLSPIATGGEGVALLRRSQGP